MSNMHQTKTVSQQWPGIYAEYRRTLKSRKYSEKYEHSKSHYQVIVMPFISHSSNLLPELYRDIAADNSSVENSIRNILNLAESAVDRRLSQPYVYSEPVLKVFLLMRLKDMQSMQEQL